MALICRYFQAGNCKFGNKCRFSHTITNEKSFTTSVSEVSIRDELLNGPEWPFSSFRDYSTGYVYFEDLSIEEVILEGRKFSSNYSEYVSLATLQSQKSFDARKNLVTSLDSISNRPGVEITDLPITSAHKMPFSNSFSLSNITSFSNPSLSFAANASSSSIHTYSQSSFSNTNSFFSNVNLSSSNSNPFMFSVGNNPATISELSNPFTIQGNTTLISGTLQDNDAMDFESAHKVVETRSNPFAIKVNSNPIDANIPLLSSIPKNHIVRGQHTQHDLSTVNQFANDSVSHSNKFFNMREDFGNRKFPILGSVPSEIIKRDLSKYDTNYLWTLGDIPELPPLIYHS